jgi:predicted double-glycine peptidase
MKSKIRLVIQQNKGYCGPASVKMVLDSYGITKTQREIGEFLGATKENGCTPKQIISGLKKINFKSSYKKNMSLKLVERYLEKNIPLIIYWSPRGYGHYSVIIGLEEDKVFIADPKKSEILSFKKSDFLRKWVDVDNSKDKHEVIIIKR